LNHDLYVDSVENNWSNEPSEELTRELDEKVDDHAPKQEATTIVSGNFGK
jgi:hypothetical protein